jgi:hypothetical protein
VTGPEHYREAEEHLEHARAAGRSAEAEWDQRQAQVHATLALAYATDREIARYSGVRG